MCDRVYERIMLLIAADLSDQKCGVQDNPGNDHGRENEAEEEQDFGTPQQNYPADIEKKDDRNEADTERNEERNGAVPTWNYHDSMFSKR
jgi:hypothetical protein